MINKKLMKRLSAVLLAATLCMSAVPGNVVYATEAEGTETSSADHKYPDGLYE